MRTDLAQNSAQSSSAGKTIAATSGIDDVAAIKAEATETAQTFAKVGIYADQRIGEILRELPTRQGARTDKTSVSMPTKVQQSVHRLKQKLKSRQALDTAIDFPIRRKL